jgi:hypothetical protein
MSKYYIVQSNQNSRGIWVEESDLADTKKYDFAGHKRVTVTEISQEEYFARIHGDVGY